MWNGRWGSSRECSMGRFEEQLKGILKLWLRTHLAEVKHTFRVLPPRLESNDVKLTASPCLQRREDQVRALRTLDDPDSSLPFIRQILSTLRTNVGSDSTVIGFIGTPWTLAAYAMEGAADRCPPISPQPPPICRCVCFRDSAICYTMALSDPWWSR